ncbi:hypothetical protein PGT21_015059 [Puccinia graminis f. sp. tritici]|nr:hypothetical protein PGTUg99_002345 [Puccinia graminis f. sp. tritici]KAA1089340.1 hypothetical protein PGT21_014492 [Puccinia graminis f. sp. tritici]KAA1092822.1 hypothetical protein PGT21_015059 [Puccinia graminis f. sp. tritici]
MLDSVTSGMDSPGPGGLLPDLNIPLADTSLDPPCSPITINSMQLPPLLETSNAENNLAEPLPISDSSRKVISTSDAPSSSSKRKWESNLLSSEFITVLDTSAPPTKRKENLNSSSLRKEKIRSLAVIMEETRNALPGPQRQLKLSDKGYYRPGSFKMRDQNLTESPGNTSAIKHLFEPGELPSGVLPEFFNVYDWRYVRACSEGEKSEVSEEGSLGWFLEVLNQCKYSETMSPDRFFWIPRAQAVSILKRYQKLNLDFGNQFIILDRAQTLRDITLRVSDDKLDLDKYPVLAKIQNELEAGLKLQMRSDPDDVTLGRIQSIIAHIKKLTKITTFLMITYLSLFKEHPNDYLSAELVSSILSFLKKFWTDAQEGKESILKEHPLLTRNLELFKMNFLQPEDKHFCETFLKNEHKRLYQMAWNIVGYWVHINGKKIKQSSINQKYYDQSVTELIGNIILAANSYEIRIKPKNIDSNM